MTDQQPQTPDRYAIADLVRALALDLDPAKAKPRAKRAKSKPHAGQSAILEGKRNSTLTSLAGSMRHRGMSEAEINAALQQVNRDRCEPPLPDNEVRLIAASIAQYPITEQATFKTLNDAGNAERLVSKYGEIIRFVRGLGWFVWNGRFWELDLTGRIVELAKEVARDIFNEAAQAPNNSNVVAKHANNSLYAARLKAMIDLATSIPAVNIGVGDMDRDPLLLNVVNGTIDLRTGKLRAHDKADFITMCAPVVYDRKARAPRFRSFLNEITLNSKELTDFLIRVLGYALTGDTSEQCLFFLYGSGANGKTTFLLVLRMLMGTELAVQMPPDTLTHKPGGRTTTNDLARLRGARAVQSTEVSEGSYLDETLIKQLTGGDRIAARQLYKEFFEFDPEFKLFIAGNHKPIIRGTDDGIWRRIYLIPFMRAFLSNEKDPELKNKLKSELPGILNIVLAGCLEWQRIGLAPPKSVIAAVQTYKEDMDILGRWITERCDVSPSASHMSSQLYGNYSVWAEQEGLKPMSHVAFGRRLAERGHAKKRTKDGVMVQGLALKPSRVLT